MGEATKIAWTDHTFNPWLGCAKVSAGCRNCYAEQLVEKRMGLRRWGNSPRVRTKGPWREVPQWHAQSAAEVKGGRRRRRVFCASLADVFEDAPGLDEIRADLWHLIEACDALDWQLLTKRPENIKRMVPTEWLARPRAHVWFGTSCEDQKTADVRVPLLLQTPAAVRFLSCEPMLGPIALRFVDRHAIQEDDSCADWCDACARRRYAAVPQDAAINWVIAGGESGPGFRPMRIEWAKSLRAQCRAAGVAFFFKQVSASRPGQGENALGEVVQEFPAP